MKHGVFRATWLPSNFWTRSASRMLPQQVPCSVYALCAVSMQVRAERERRLAEKHYLEDACVVKRGELVTNSSRLETCFGHAPNVRGSG